MFARTLISLLVSPLVLAAIHDIQVGGPNGELQFYPEAIGAQAGDQVVFHFRPKNHTVTQSSFDNPCGPKDGGFDSGFEPVMANQTEQPTYTFTVHDTKPIWMYCRQKVPVGHCGKGMVFAVNCGPDGAPNSFTNFKNAALAIGASEAANTGPSATAPAYSYSIPAAPTPTPSATPTLSATPTPSAAATTGPTIHTVVVGGPNRLLFDPEFITANVNDIVMFQFKQKNHTVTQSSFADPCSGLNANGVTGFDSGFNYAVPDNAQSFPTWNLTINNTEPIWAYCRQPNPSSHCEAGMVFAINPNQSSEKNYSAFVNNAKASSTSTSASNGSDTASSSGALPIRVSGVLATFISAGFLALVL